MNQNTLLKRILWGYWSKGKAFFSLLVFILSAVLLSILIVFPLWSFATKKPQGYTIFTLILMGTGILWLIYRKFTRIKQNQALPEYKNAQKKHRRFFWLNLGKTVLTLFCIYTVFTLFSSGSFLSGTILLPVFFFLLGWVYFGKTSGRKKPRSL